MKRNTFSIVASDGVKYEEPTHDIQLITNAGLQNTELPAFFLIDFVGLLSCVHLQASGLKYGSRTTSTMDTLDMDLYKFIDEYTLGLLPPLRGNNEEDEL